MAMTYIEEQTLKNFELYFPTNAESMNDYEINGTTLVATLSNGRKVLYDDIINACRMLPKDPNNMTDDEIMDEFKYRLRNMMNIKGINITTLAELTGIHRPTLSNYLMGKQKPSIIKLDKIARALDCSLDDLRYR